MRIEREMTKRSIGPGDACHLVGRGRRKLRDVAFGGIGDRKMTGLVQDIAGMGHASLIDEDRAMADIEAGQDRFFRQRRGAHFDADAAHECHQPLGERIGEGSRCHSDQAAFASASLAAA